MQNGNMPRRDYGNRQTGQNGLPRRDAVGRTSAQGYDVRQQRNGGQRSMQNTVNPNRNRQNMQRQNTIRQNMTYQNAAGQNARSSGAPRPAMRQGTGSRSGAVGYGSARITVDHRPQVKPRRSYAKRVRKKQKSTVTSVAVVLIVTIVISTFFLVVRSVNWETFMTRSYMWTFSNPSNILFGPDLTDAERDSYVTKYVNVDKDDVYRGHCILVNADHEYHFREDEVGTEILSVYKNKTNSYKVNSGKELLHIDTIHAFNDMMDAFQGETGSRAIMINSAYRTAEDQQEVYEYYEETKGKDYAEAYVQKPGFSEHHTGYGFDLAVFEEYEDESSAMWSFDGKGIYFWVDENCAKYGFVLRYSASKEAITGISYESWHYRYVGKGNALAMGTMGSCLEEYITNTKTYSYEEPYYVEAADGSEFQIYYVKSNGKDGQKIPIPTTALNYDISGNNVDGFIVAVQIVTGKRF